MYKKSLRIWPAFFAMLLLISIMTTSGVARAKSTTWRMTTPWPPSISLIEADKYWVNLVNQLAGDALKIRFFDGGTLIPGFELFDAVSRGTLQAAGDWPNYWAGKNIAFDLLGAYPMGLTASDYIMWLYDGGGLELYQEIYGKYDIVYLPYWVSSTDSGVRGNKPIRSLEDYKNLKIRMAGRAQGKILKDLGASQVMLAGGEVYQALEKGVIDAGEFASPDIDWGMGFQEVTSYWASPGWHQPSGLGGVMINKKAWDALPKKTQELLKILARATMVWSFSHFNYTSATATDKFMKKGIKVTRLSDADLEKVKGLAFKHLLEESRDNPLFAKIAYSQLSFLKYMNKWRTVAAPFAGPVRKIPDLAPLKACVK